ncbi:MAG TPA: ATP-binding protein [Albitalea sp.]|nr:ATP-binding protein [Albitalea sp.]
MTDAIPRQPSRLDLLEQDLEHFQRFAASSDDVYWLADLPSGTLIFVSPQFERTWGISRERLVADPTLWNQAVVEEDRQRLPVPFFADPPDSSQTLREYRIVGPGKSPHWIRDRRFHLRDATGRTVRIGGIAEDVSSRRSRELELDELLAREREARADAETLARSKDEFLAVVTHELRSPLNAIRGWAHVLRRSGELSDMQRKALDAIDRNTVAQAQMVDDLLDSQRILCGNFHLEPSRVPLVELIAEAVDAVQPAAGAKHIRIEVQHDPAIDIVTVDLRRLRQALSGLLSNAVKFTPEDGEIQVTSRGGDQTLTIEVQDNGIGLEPEQLAHVFEPFKQADASSTRQQSGLGLGLSLARQLVELHGGQIAVHSEGVGRGARFTITLPQPAPSEPDAEPPAPDGHPLAGKRIVIVEDDPDGREVLALILGEARVELRSFDRAATAFDYLARLAPGEQPDALISDIAMPDEDGYAFIRRLRQMERGQQRPHLIALALTAFGRAEDKVRALKAGFDAHMAKPIDTERVLNAIAEAFRNAAASAAPS